MNLVTLRASVAAHEGCVLVMYRDSRDVPTLGYGHNLTTPISQRAADLMLDDDLGAAVATLLLRYPWVSGLDDVRQNVLAELTFMLGIRGLAGFVKMLAACEAKDFDAASHELLASQLPTQVGTRAYTLATRLRTGQE